MASRTMPRKFRRVGGIQILQVNFRNAEVLLSFRGSLTFKPVQEGEGIMNELSNLYLHYIFGSCILFYPKTEKWCEQNEKIKRK